MTAKSCGLGCLKYLMMIFNFVVFLAGIVLVAVSVWVLIDSSEFRDLVNVRGTVQSMFLSIWLLFGVGVSLVLLSVMGCMGSSKQSRCLLGMYSFLIIIVFLVEIVVCIMAFAFYPQVKEVAISTTDEYGLEAIQPDFLNMTDSEQALIHDVTKYWDKLQNSFECCGFASAQDWEKSQFANWTMEVAPVNSTVHKFPPSCCGRYFSDVYAEQNKTQLYIGACDYDHVELFTKGKACESLAKDNFVKLGATGLGILGIEILAMMASCCLFRNLQEDF